MQRLRLLLRQPQNGGDVAAVHGDGRGVLGRVLVLAVQQHHHRSRQADVHLQVLVAQILLLGEVLFLTHQKLEHVLTREQRYEQQSHGDDARLRIQRGDGQTEKQEHGQGAHEGRHLFLPKSSRGGART